MIYLRLLLTLTLSLFIFHPILNNSPTRTGPTSPIRITTPNTRGNKITTNDKMAKNVKSSSTTAKSISMNTSINGMVLSRHGQGFSTLWESVGGYSFWPIFPRGQGVQFLRHNAKTHFRALI